MKLWEKNTIALRSLFLVALVREKQMYRDLSSKETHAAIKTHFDLVKEECGVLDYKEVEVEMAQ